MTHDEIDRLSIDGLIAECLPPWMSTASAEQLDGLHRALIAQQRSQQVLQASLGNVLGPDAFGEPLLKAALAAHVPRPLDVRAACVQTTWFELVPPLVPSPPFTYIAHSSVQSLLAAALHNFSESDTQDNAFSAQSRLFDEARRGLPMSPQAFARLCRALDIGGQYQRYVQERFAPADAIARAALYKQMENGLRHDLEVACRLGSLWGTLDERSYRQVLPLTHDRPVIPGEPAHLRPRQLYLLGKRIRGVATLEVHNGPAAGDAPSGVIAWLPDDPQGAIARFATWEHLYQTLGARLRNSAYQGYFARFIGEADRAGFSLGLQRLVAASQTGPLALDGRHQPASSSLIAHLRQERLDKIQSDARVLAVSTGDEDRLARSRRLQGYVEAGLDVLNLASLFVPALGAVMLGVAALQIAQEVYEGYEDWAIGDREGALGHLFAVAGNLAATAAFAAGGAAVTKALERVPFVDDLLPVPAADGGLRLIDPSLAAYRVEREEVGVGLSGAEGKQYLRVGQSSYQVSADGRHIRHPGRDQAYSPRIYANRSGGWVHEFEDPRHWRDYTTLLRRFGADFAQVSEAQALALAQSCALDPASLIQLHVERAPAPARLLDARQRQQLHARYPDLDNAAFAERLAAAQPPDGTAETLLRRHFPGLTPRCARAVIDTASHRERRDLLTQHRVSLALAERARWLLRDSRLDRACAGFTQPAAMNLDGEILALALSHELLPWAPSVRVEIHDLQGAALHGLGAAEATDVRRIQRHAEGYLAVDDACLALPGAQRSDDLAQALLWHMDPAQRAIPEQASHTAQTFAQAIASLAMARRGELPGWLGMAPVGRGVRPPVRRGDGRLGYPLGGERLHGRRAITHALRRIYPELTNRGALNYIEHRLQEGLAPWQQVSQMQLRLSRLEQVLNAWQSGVTSHEAATSRRNFASQLLRGWRLQTLSPQASRVELAIEGEWIGQLPPLPEDLRFEQVTHLRLRDLLLEALPEDFLARFPRLEHLDLRDNRLRALPAGLEHRTELRGLDLSDNQIVLSTAQNRRLALLYRLRELNLSRNPLVAPPDLARLTSLREVSVRDCRLAHVPTGLARLAQLQHLDLRDNRLVLLDPGFYQLPAVRRGRIHLHDNPLDGVTVARLWAASESAQPTGVTHLSGAEQAGRDHWLRLIDEDLRVTRQLQWDALAQAPGAADLMRLLDDLRDTEDFVLLGKELARRVWRVVDACEQDSVLRARLFELAALPRNCADSAAMSFSLLEVQSWVHEQAGGLQGEAHEQALMRLGRALFRLDEVDAAASRDIEVRSEWHQDFDEVEVRLAYRHGLAQSLGLPGQPEYTRYTAMAEVSSEDLLNVRGSVLVAERSPRLAASLTQRDFWLQHLRQAYPERFEAVEQPFEARLELLDAQAQSGSSASYLNAIDALASERESRLQALVQTLTAEAFARYPL